MSELIDLVNHDGVIIERGVVRDDLERWEGLFMQIALVVITNSLGEILVHERGSTKTVDPNKIDHVCGTVQSGRTAEETAFEEAQQEVGVVPRNLRKVWKGINVYDRHCTIFSGNSDETPTISDPDEVEWAAYKPLNELLAGKESGELQFVGSFFEDLNLALNSQNTAPE